jgi:hypothetical protein
MQANLGTIDRAARAILGLGLIAATLTGTIGLWGWIGMVPLATSLVAFCPAYRLFSFATCPITRT